MSRKYNPYVFYTEYYLISGAYQVINVVNGILTYSASYSDNIKEYLRNQVASKQVALNELIRNNECNARVNGNANPDNDVDEDGFVVIKMRRPKKNKNEFHDSNDNKNDNINGNGSASVIHDNINMDQNVSLKSHNDIVQQIVDNMIKDVVEKLSKNYKAN
jgi:hypothetical protein